MAASLFEPGIPSGYVLLLLTMVLSGLVLSLTAFYVHRKNKGPATAPFVILLLLCAAWSFLNAAILLPQDPGQKMLLEQIEYMSIIFIPVALLVTIFAYLGRTSLLHPRTYAPLLVVPAVSVVMLLTNDYHHLFFAAHDFSMNGELLVMRSISGPYFLFHLLYILILFLIALFLLFQHMRSVEGEYRKRDLYILVGIFLPFIGEAISLLGYPPVPGVSWAPVLFMAMGFLLLYALFRYRGFDLMPLAHDLVWKNTPDPLFVLDEGGRLVDVNEAGSRLLNGPPERAIGRQASDIIPIVGTALPMLNARGTKVPTVYRDRSGRDYEVQISPVKDSAGRSLGTLALFRDITLQKALQEETRQSERRYRLLIENIPFPIAVVAIDTGTVNLVNSGMEELLKGRRASIIDRDLGSFFLSREDLERLFSALAQDRWVENFEAAMMNVTGETFWAYLSAMPVELGGEQVAILAIHDISDHKMAEALKVANKKLNLLSGITRHDLLNKLTAINGYISLLAMTEDPEKRKRLIAKLELSANAAQELIQFTRDYEQLGVMAPTWQSVDEAIERARSRLDLSGVNVEVYVGAVTVYADSMLDKVFYNLMDNSLRHGEAVKRIRIYCEYLGDQGLNVVYEDDGAGISYEDKKRLFQQGMGRNTGQGTFLIKEILKITGITISEDGEPGKGVRFKIRLLPSMYGRQEPTGEGAQGHPSVGSLP